MYIYLTSNLPLAGNSSVQRIHKTSPSIDVAGFDTVFTDLCSSFTLSCVGFIDYMFQN